MGRYHIYMVNQNSASQRINTRFVVVVFILTAYVEKPQALKQGHSASIYHILPKAGQKNIVVSYNILKKFWVGR